MHIVFIIILVLILLIAAVSFGMSAYSMRVPGQSLEQARKWQEDHYDISWYDGIEKEDYIVKSYDGYELHAQHIINPARTDKYIIISHGYTDNRMGSLKYAKLYLDLGFDPIIYDLRGHGENVYTYCTYSIRESRDLNEMIRDAHVRFPGCSLLGIHGESLGAATSIAVLRYKPHIDFVVADCGFSEVTPVLKNGLGWFHLPGWLVFTASQFTKLRYGYFYRDMRPIDSLEGCDTPILFIHGEKDDLIPPSNSYSMKEKAEGHSEIFIAEGAVHAESILTQPEGYRESVENSFRNIGVM